MLREKETKTSKHHTWLFSVVVISKYCSLSISSRRPYHFKQWVLIETVLFWAYCSRLQTNWTFLLIPSLKTIHNWKEHAYVGRKLEDGRSSDICWILHVNRFINIYGFPQCETTWVLGKENLAHFKWELKVISFNGFGTATFKVKGARCV